MSKRVSQLDQSGEHFFGTAAEIDVHERPFAVGSERSGRQFIT